VVQESFNASRKMSSLRVGDVVEVRSAEEILATLDENGEFEDLPFMPEMLQFCGQRLTVHKSAHKLCDYIGGTGLRWMNSAVHLSGVRCSGVAHGGCQTGCSLYWKEAWLRPVAVSDVDVVGSPLEAEPVKVDVSVLERATRKARDADGTERFSCQATEMSRAAPERVRFWHLDQYVADLKSGNVGPLALIRGFLFHLFNVYQDRSRRILPSWLQFKDGMAWGFVKGRVVGETPTGHLDLQVDELVRIKSREEIAATINSKRLNRGMGFEEEMARYCGKTAMVVRRVDRCIDDRTGRLLTMKSPCIVLAGVVCKGVYHGNCPREFAPFWREIWLERVDVNRERAVDDVGR
jgi:hypothetical protein